MTKGSNRRAFTGVGATVALVALLCVPGAVASAADPTPSDAVTLGCGSADIDWRQAEGSTINVLMITTQEAEAIKELVPAFEDLTGITVNWDSLEQNAEIDKLNVEFRSGAGSIDAFQVDFMLLPEWAENGYLEPLDAYLSDPALTDAEWYDSGDFLGGIWTAGQWDGVQYLIPMSAESSILIYRKDIFDEKGLAVPTTFEELEATAAALNDPPTIYGIGNRGLRGSGQNVYIWTSFLRGFGGDFFKDFPNDYTPTLDTPEAIAATQLYADLDIKYGPPGVANWSNLETYQGAKDGVTAMYVDATPHAPLVDDPSTSTYGKWATAMVPAGPAGAFPAIYSHTIGINAASDNKVAAWLWTQCMTGPESEHVRALKTGDPARTSSFETDAFKEILGDVGGGTYLTTAVESMNQALPDFRPRFPGWNKVGDPIGAAVQSVIAGEADAESAMKSAQADVLKMMQEDGYIE